MSITQKQLIETIAYDFPEGIQLTRPQVYEVLNRFGIVVAAALADGKDVALPVIGKLKPIQRAARTGRNPQTGEAIQIPAKRVVKLTVSKKLTDHLNS